MIRGVLREVRGGYSWPGEWNAICLEYHHLGWLEPVPATIFERLGRAIEWGWRELCVRVSDAIHPDGPRG